MAGPGPVLKESHRLRRLIHELESRIASSPKQLIAQNSKLQQSEDLLKAAERLVPADGGPLFEDWCVADTDFSMMLQRLIKTGHDVSARVRDYADAQWERPSVQEFVRQSRPPYKAMQG